MSSRHSNRQVRSAVIETLEDRRMLSQTIAYSYSGPGEMLATGVTANWYTTPQQSVNGDTLRGLSANQTRPLILANLPVASNISIAFDLA